MWVASYGVMPHTYSLAVPLAGPRGTTAPLAVSYAVRLARVPGTGDGREGDDHDFMAGEPSAQKRNAR
jgi:hypothetical protein